MFLANAVLLTVISLLQIPRNLRLMYVHAYQSYVWNAIVSERIRVGGCTRPIIGDLVLEDPEATPEPIVDPATSGAVEDDPAEVTTAASGPSAAAEPTAVTPTPRRKAHDVWQPPRVRMLSEDDLSAHTIFDVVYPLPGKDVVYPGGVLGERYRVFLSMDGLDPDGWERKQKCVSICPSPLFVPSLSGRVCTETTA